MSDSTGDHVTTILAQRQHLNLSSELHSDSQPLNDLVADKLKAVPEIRCMRDPRKGGLASILDELCHSSAYTINLD